MPCHLKSVMFRGGHSQQLVPLKAKGRLLPRGRWTGGHCQAKHPRGVAPRQLKSSQQCMGSDGRPACGSGGAYKPQGASEVNCPYMGGQWAHAWPLWLRRSWVCGLAASARNLPSAGFTGLRAATPLHGAMRDFEAPHKLSTGHIAQISFSAVSILESHQP